MKFSGKRKARILGFQILFQRSKIGIVPAGEEFLRNCSGLQAKELEFAMGIADQCWKNMEDIDATIRLYLKKTWKQNRLQPQLNTLLRTGCAEIIYLRPNNPKVIINETLEICKQYCKPNSVKICNGILDSVWKQKPLQPEDPLPASFSG